jgi:hypothetical protein
VLVSVHQWGSLVGVDMGLYVGSLVGVAVGVHWLGLS